MFSPPLVLASLSGNSDAAWARAGSASAGGAILGGVALDAPARDAARDLVARGREEFLPADPLAFLERELAVLEDCPISAGVNVRSSTVGPVVEAARLCRDRETLLEINAHCRQPELRAVGCGETLLSDEARLSEYVERAAATGATVGVKVRAEVPGVDLPALAGTLAAAGATYIHVDAMDSEAVVGEVAAASDLYLIANNGVRDEATIREYLDYGADAVSVGRPSEDPAALARIRRALESVLDSSAAAREPQR
ncbi:beta/alpha barrel domain-containing protein [Natronobiforma cellulositropha]|uniref:dihydropyrimidine dehydrogenase n=1 Tax=Natronobiforma cellulositropha TaxID=1679076 RepID=UPI0021D5F24F|nr:dihydropyrimidine dehydrogenase [Natronobiforma cellulositropha]